MGEKKPFIIILAGLLLVVGGLAIVACDRGAGRRACRWLVGSGVSARRRARGQRAGPDG